MLPKRAGGVGKVGSEGRYLPSLPSLAAVGNGMEFFHLIRFSSTRTRTCMYEVRR